MKKIILETPYGQESLYQSTLDAVILHLSDRLSAVTSVYSAFPAVAGLVDRMLPTVREECETRTTSGMAYLEVTPDALAGFGFSLRLDDLPDLPPLYSTLDCWGLAMAVAEGLRAETDDPDGVTIFPLYVENALGLAVRNARVTVGLRLGTSP